MLILNFFGVVDLKSLRSSGDETPIVTPQDLIPGADKFGSLKVVITTNGTTFVSGIEVDVGERPGGNMAVEITDNNGTAFFEKIPVGNFVIFFNDSTYPQNFEKVQSLIPVKIIEGETTEQKIELKPAE